MSEKEPGASPVAPGLVQLDEKTLVSVRLARSSQAPRQFRAVALAALQANHRVLSPAPGQPVTARTPRPPWTRAWAGSGSRSPTAGPIDAGSSGVPTRRSDGKRPTLGDAGRLQPCSKQ